MADEENSKENRRGDPEGESGGLTIPEISGSGLTSLMHTGFGLTSPLMKDIYLREQAIVGTRFLGGADELVEDLEVGSRITFLREMDNAFDEKAVMALDEEGRKLGYMPRRENELVAALMDAGKYFYGIITTEPEGDYNGSRIPGSIWVDLYMREFALPGDLSEIPLQGAGGSYAVLDLVFTRRVKTGNKIWLSEIFIIKVIHGEETGRFHRVYDPDKNLDSRAATDMGEERFAYLSDVDASSDYDQMVRDISGFLGYLPLVVHDIAEEELSALREDYGMILGRTLSNRIIDTRRMAENHLPFITDYSLDGLAEHLGIEVDLEEPGEQRCRIIWQLYRRMERSEL